MERRRVSTRRQSTVKAPTIKDKRHKNKLKLIEMLMRIQLINIITLTKVEN